MSRIWSIFAIAIFTVSTTVTMGSVAYAATTVTIDCATEPSFQNVWWDLNDDQVTFTSTNCDWVGIRPDGGADPLLGANPNPPATVTLQYSAVSTYQKVSFWTYDGSVWSELGYYKVRQGSYTPPINQAKTVTFDPNGGTGSLAAQSSSASTNLTSNAGSITNPNFTFAGWNTAANGSGTPFSDGDQYDFSADITLFAQWTAVSSGSGSSPSTPPASNSGSSALSSPSAASANPVLASSSSAGALANTGSQATVLMSVAGLLAIAGAIVLALSMWRRRTTRN